MKKFIPLIIVTFSFSEDSNVLYEQAQEYENQGNYKEAMLLYKKIASSNFSKEDKYIVDGYYFLKGKTKLPVLKCEVKEDN